MNDQASFDSDPLPEGALTLKLIPTRHDANLHGDISAGWVVAQMDLAAETVVTQVAQGRIANVSMESVAFLAPIHVGAVTSIYTHLLDIGSSSVRIAVEVWTRNPLDSTQRKVVDAVFVYVAIDEHGRIRRVPRK